MPDRRGVGVIATVVLSGLLVGCGGGTGSDLAWPAYSDGYSAGVKYSGAGNQTRDYCRSLAAQRFGDADSREGIVFVAGCGQAANGIPKDSQEDIEANYQEESAD